MSGKPLNRPVNSIAPTPSNAGYWESSSDGGVFNFGDAQFLGSMGAQPLNQPIVGMAPMPAVQGYWLVAADGGVFNFGGAGFHGSMGGTHLNKPIVGMAATPTGQGYWLVAADGGIFNFGDAGFYGSMGGNPLNQPVVGISATPSGQGYWLVAADGGVFAFGDAQFLGSMAGQRLNQPMVGMSGAGSGSSASGQPRGRKIVVSLSLQHLWAYNLDGTLFLQTDVATGRPELPTPTGDYHIFKKQAPFQFISPWPTWSPFWYPSAWVSYAMEFIDGGYYLHDAPWRTWYGPGAEFGSTGTHGCVNVPLTPMGALYSWAQIGDEVVVQN
jgi:hypothetical protein